MKTYISGSIAYDYIMMVQGAFDESIMPDNLHNLSVGFLLKDKQRHFGGTAGNIAYNLHLLGEKPNILASIGADGADYLDRLESWGCSTDRILSDSKNDTAAAYISTDSKGKQITFFYPGAMNSGVDEIDLSQIAVKLTENEGLVGEGTGLDSFKKPLLLIAPDGILKILKYVEECRKQGIDFIFDPGQNLPYFSREQLINCVDGAKGMILNDYEFEMFKKNSGLTEAEILGRLELLIVTLGGEGSVIKFLGENGGNKSENGGNYKNGAECNSAPTVECNSAPIVNEINEIHVPVFVPKNIAEPTGCGDAYRAGLLYGLGKGYKLEKCARIGALCGTYAVECTGTQNHAFTIEEFEERLGGGI